MSHWTAAALIVGTGAAAVALGHNAFSSASNAPGTVTTVTTPQGQHGGATATGPQVRHSVTTSSGSGVSTTAPANTAPTTHGSTAPRANHPVTTTSGSGVTTTTTHVNGKTVITRTIRSHGGDD